MNHWNTSPVAQTNEIAGQYTPKDDSSPNTRGDKNSMRSSLLAEDLQKIRRSNHSAHRGQRALEDAMDDDEHDGIIKGLLYPCLEDSTTGFDFFEEDYEEAQSAVRSSAAGTETTPTFRRSTEEHAVHQGTVNLNDMEVEQNSYYTSYYSSMGRPYSDLSHEKLRR